MPQRSGFCKVAGMACGDFLYKVSIHFLMEGSGSPNHTAMPAAFLLARGWFHRPGSPPPGEALLEEIVLKSLCHTESLASTSVFYPIALDTVTGLPTFASSASGRKELNSARPFTQQTFWLSFWMFPIKPRIFFWCRTSWFFFFSLMYLQMKFIACLGGSDLP